MEYPVVWEIFLMFNCDITNQTEANSASQLMENLAAIGISIWLGKLNALHVFTCALCPHPHFSFVLFKLLVRATGILYVEMCGAQYRCRLETTLHLRARVMRFQIELLACVPLNQFRGIWINVNFRLKSLIFTTNIFLHLMKVLNALKMKN